LAIFAIFIDAERKRFIDFVGGAGNYWARLTTLVVNSELGLMWLDAPTENSKSIMNKHDRKLKIDHEQTWGLANTNS
jgi:hypothetical protein